jgi:hypothetical protein
MVHCDSSTAATPRIVDGVQLNTNALLGGTRPERALVFLARGREDNRGGRGKVTKIYTHTLNAVGAASAVRLTDCWGQEAAAEPCRGIAT